MGALGAVAPPPGGLSGRKAASYPDKSAGLCSHRSTGDYGDLAWACGAIGMAALRTAGGEIMVAAPAAFAIGGAVATVSGVGLLVIGGITFVAGAYLLVETCT
jgi:hypothetical protein